MSPLLLQGVASGIVTGCVYALIALSLVIVYKSSDVINFAGGEMVMLGGYLGMFGLLWLGLPYLLIFPFGALMIFIIGALFDRVVLTRVVGRAMPGPEHPGRDDHRHGRALLRAERRGARHPLHRGGAPPAAVLLRRADLHRPGGAAASGHRDRRRGDRHHGGAVGVLQPHPHRQGAARHQPEPARRRARRNSGAPDEHDRVGPCGRARRRRRHICWRRSC